MDDNNIEAVACEEGSGQKSVFIDGFTAEEGWIINKTTGEKYPDVPIRRLRLSKRCINALYRWGKRYGFMEEGEVYLSSVILKCGNMLDVKNIGVRTLEEFDEVVSRYLSPETATAVVSDDSESGSADDVGQILESVRVLPDWEPAGENLLKNRTTGQVIPDAPIGLLGLNVRATNCLCSERIANISDLAGMEYQELLCIKNFGKNTLDNLISKLDLYFKRNSTGTPVAVQREEKNDVCLPKTDTVILPRSATRKLSEGVIVQDGSIIRISDGMVIGDADISELYLDRRGEHCLRQSGIKKVSQLVGMTYDGLLGIKNLGLRSANDIRGKLEYYLRSCTAICPESGAVTVLSEATITEYFSENPFAAPEREELIALFPEEKRDGAGLLLDSLVENRTLVCENGRYRKNCPSFYECLDIFAENGKESDRMNRDIVLMRADGKTLDDIGRECGITRERVRQREAKAVRKTRILNGDIFDEDRYAYLYENYCIDPSFFGLIADNRTAYYLTLRYKGGSRPAIEALEDGRIPVNIRRRLEEWLYRDYITVESGERLAQSRPEIEDYVLKTYCSEGCSFEEFRGLYNEFVLSCGLSREKTERLLLDEDEKDGRINRLASSPKVLWSKNRHLRYYDISLVDADELWETLALWQYHNIELSTLKFVRSYPELMEKYDIRDEYELHNLLKKLPRYHKNPDIVFSKMPTLRIGVFDRDAAVRKALFESAPISYTDLGEKLSEIYGFRADVICSNWFSGIMLYYHDGIFCVDYEKMPPEHMKLLSDALKDDLYFYDELRTIYRRCVPGADVSLISTFNLRLMGLEPAGSYAYRNYRSAEAYFRHLFTDKDIVDASRFHDRLRKIQLYCQTFASLRRDYEIIEFEPMQYINIRRLNRIGITKDDLRSYCREVYDFVGEDRFFTVEYLRNLGFTSEIDNLGFSDLFSISLLRESPDFSNWHLGGNRLFLSDRRTSDRGGSSGAVSLSRLLASLFDDMTEIEVDDLIGILRDEYNIVLDRWKIIEAAGEASLYYDRIMDRIYRDYDTYFDDI